MDLTLNQCICKEHTKGLDGLPPVDWQQFVIALHEVLVKGYNYIKAWLSNVIVACEHKEHRGEHDLQASVVLMVNWLAQAQTSESNDDMVNDSAAGKVTDENNDDNYWMSLL